MNILTMRFLLYISIYALIATSCSPQYIEVIGLASPSVDTSLKAEQGGLQFSYDFWQEGGIMSLTIENTSRSAVMLDLTRSHAIINGAIYPYFTGITETTGEVTTRSRTRWGTYILTGDASLAQKSWSEVNVTSVQQQPSAHIPPEARIVVMHPILNENRLAPLPAEKPKADGKHTEPLRFTDTNSPHKFRNYLTFMREDTTDKRPLVIDHSFYVNRIWLSHPMYFYGSWDSDTPSKSPFRSIHRFYLKGIKRNRATVSQPVSFIPSPPPKKVVD